MRLYSDDLIKLDCTRGTGILYAAWQGQRPYAAEEVRKAFIAVVACARERPVTRLLLNFADNTQDLTEAAYKGMLGQLAVGLLPTSVRRIACVGTGSAVRERRIASAYREIAAALEAPLEFQFFSKRIEALRWLTQEGPPS
ncbi:hypothetical protein GCM10023188_19200 [Pontibacter saemangeumensis]|uniref:SpoIIAA-like n=1 Tax=Pontibacter saemangeumensis TaxID=1084525 RepID=A0ABP8LLG7_9BACT